MSVSYVEATSEARDSTFAATPQPTRGAGEAAGAAEAGGTGTAGRAARGCKADPRPWEGRRPANRQQESETDELGGEEEGEEPASSHGLETPGVGPSGPETGAWPWR